MAGIKEQTVCPPFQENRSCFCKGLRENALTGRAPNIHSLASSPLKRLLQTQMSFQVTDHHRTLVGSFLSCAWGQKQESSNAGFLSRVRFDLNHLMLSLVLRSWSQCGCYLVAETTIPVCHSLFCEPNPLFPQRPVLLSLTCFQTHYPKCSLTHFFVQNLTVRLHPATFFTD